MIRSGKLLTSTGEQAAKLDLGDAVNRMLRAFRVRGDAVATMRDYVAELFTPDLDVDDAIKALDRFSRLLVPGHDNRFEPNPVQIREEVRRVNEMFTSPRPKLEALAPPPPKVRTEEEKAFADQAVADLRASLTAGKETIGSKPVGHPWLRQYHAERAAERAQERGA